MSEFAEFLKQKRQEKGYTLRGFAEMINVAPSYLSDIEKDKRNAPSDEIIAKIAKVLDLDSNDTSKLYDLASLDKDTLAGDIASYVSNVDAIKVALRKAKDLDFGEDEWIKIIEEIEKKGI